MLAAEQPASECSPFREGFREVSGLFLHFRRTCQQYHAIASHCACELDCASGNRVQFFLPSFLTLSRRNPPPPLFFLDLLFFPATTSNDNETSTAIVPDRARYHVFEMDGVDFLIGTGDDGRLDVRDTFVCDSTNSKSFAYAADDDAPTPSYSRPEGHDSPDLPQQPLPFVAVPWELRFDGDTLYKKPAWSKLLKVYLIAASRTEPSVRLDLTQVVSLDAATRSVRREEVMNRATASDPQHTTLRIR